MSGSRVDRLVTAAFGAFLVGIAVLSLVSADRSARAGASLVALVLGLLGVDALVAAVRGRRALVSRIGPLP
jgi:hypothetical protein